MVKGKFKYKLFSRSNDAVHCQKVRDLNLTCKVLKKANLKKKNRIMAPIVKAHYLRIFEVGTATIELSNWGLIRRQLSLEFYKENLNICNRKDEFRRFLFLVFFYNRYLRSTLLIILTFLNGCTCFSSCDNTKVRDMSVRSAVDLSAISLLSVSLYR